MNNTDSLVRAIETRARPIQRRIDLKSLIAQISRAKIVMLGEASHGTQEFYDWRRVISAWLIVKHGFRFVAVEGDWPPCWELNRYIHSGKDGGHARDVLRHFKRWPTWMWANTQIARFGEWMRTHNTVVPDDKKIGFFGLDVYSLFESIDAVLAQLERINPMLARRARIQYECFDPFRWDEKSYVLSLKQVPGGCQREVAQVLQDLLALRLESEKESLFNVQQNARVVANAENYYRTMIHGNEDSWNVRDRHMLETLEQLLEHCGPDSKAIVWAHNTHIGDYRATDMVLRDQVNIGGLARQKWGASQVALVGFGTYRGEVVASHAWDGPVEILSVPPAKEASYEAIFHEAAERLGHENFFVDLHGGGTRRGPLSEIRGHRAIGVVYNPAFEGLSNYVSTSLAERYDAFLFIGQTTALEYLAQGFEHADIPETWPRGF